MFFASEELRVQGAPFDILAVLKQRNRLEEFYHWLITEKPADLLTKLKNANPKQLFLGLRGTRDYTIFSDKLLDLIPILKYKCNGDAQLEKICSILLARIVKKDDLAPFFETLVKCNPVIVQKVLQFREELRGISLTEAYQLWDDEPANLCFVRDSVRSAYSREILLYFNQYPDEQLHEDITKEIVCRIHNECGKSDVQEVVEEIQSLVDDVRRCGMDFDVTILNYVFGYYGGS